MSRLTRRSFGRKLRCASFAPHSFNVRLKKGLFRMNSGNETDKDSDDWDEIFERKLKSLSTKQIESIIADALGKAVGADYQAELKAINFEPFQNNFSSDATEISLVIRKKQEKSPF